MTEVVRSWNNTPEERVEYAYTTEGWLENETRSSWVSSAWDVDSERVHGYDPAGNRTSTMVDSVLAHEWTYEAGNRLDEDDGNAADWNVHGELEGIAGGYEIGRNADGSEAFVGDGASVSYAITRDPYGRADLSARNERHGRRPARPPWGLGNGLPRGPTAADPRGKTRSDLSLSGWRKTPDDGTDVLSQVWGNPELDLPLVTWDAGGNAHAVVGIEGLLVGRANEGGSWTAAASDHLGSVVLDGTTWMDIPEAFGEGAEVAWSQTSRHMYAGLEALPGLPLQLSRARLYDPTVGRFTSVDPIGLRGGDHRFVYANSEPTSFVDPGGLLAGFGPSKTVYDGMWLGAGADDRAWGEDGTYLGTYSTASAAESASEAYNGSLANYLADVAAAEADPAVASSKSIKTEKWGRFGAGAPRWDSATSGPSPSTDAKVTLPLPPADGDSPSASPTDSQPGAGDSGGGAGAGIGAEGEGGDGPKAAGPAGGSPSGSSSGRELSPFAGFAGKLGIKFNAAPMAPQTQGNPFSTIPTKSFGDKLFAFALGVGAGAGSYLADAIESMETMSPSPRSNPFKYSVSTSVRRISQTANDSARAHNPGWAEAGGGVGVLLGGGIDAAIPGPGGELNALVRFGTSHADDLGKVATRGGMGPVRTGQAGEAAVRSAYDIGEKVPIGVAGRVRIPDGFTAEGLSEVKNVGSLSYTQQLRDFTTYAADNGRRFDLYTRPETQLSGPLLDAIDSGAINRMNIP